MADRPVVSVIIPTIGRHSLGRAIESALAQEIPDGGVEIVVVNDSGRALTTAGAEIEDRRVTVIATNRRRVSVARNTGAAVAHGRYLLFLDDDDWLVPGALTSLTNIMQEQPDLVAAYGGVMFTDERRHVLGTLNLGHSGNCASQMLAGAFIQLGSVLILADAFFKARGFDLAMVSSQDIDLTRRLAMIGNFGNTPAPIVSVLRGQGWTTSIGKGASVEYLRTSRERMIDQADAFPRLMRSAQSPYWHGRNVKAYAASAYWNLKRGRLMRVFSRALGGLGAALHAGTALFRGGFWQALRDTQVPATSWRVLEDSAKGEKDTA